MQLYVSDYLGATRALTAEQHGAYLLLLMSMWNAEGDLPNEPKTLARLACCTPSRWAKICGPVLAKFDVEGDRLTHVRLGLELKKAQEKSIKRADAGTKGGNAKALKHKGPALANASGLLCHSSEPEPEPEKKETDTAKAVSPSAKPRQSPAGFDEFWEAYPRKVGKLAALTAWKRLKPPLVPALAAIARYRQTKPADIDFCHPATWLNQGRWMDEHGEATGPPVTVDPARVAAMTADFKARQRAYMDELDAADASH